MNIPVHRRRRINTTFRIRIIVHFNCTECKFWVVHVTFEPNIRMGFSLVRIPCFFNRVNVRYSTTLSKMIHVCVHSCVYMYLYNSCVQLEACRPNYYQSYHTVQQY